MTIIKKDFTYDDDIDVLIRVYDNQSSTFDEKEQICSEVLFKPYLNKEHERFTSWLPRGAVNAIVQVLNSLKDNDLKIQISNELPNNVGVLTSCRENFDNSLEWKNLE